MKPRVKTLAALAPLVLLLAAPLRAQQDVQLTVLPDSISTRVIALYNSGLTTRFTGESRIASGSTVAGNVAVLGGPVTVAGRVDGHLVVINGDLRLEAGAAVRGDVVVVGGQITGQELAAINGRVLRFAEPLRFRTNPDGTISEAPPVRDALSAGRDFTFGRADLLLSSRSGYNRVEGLPIQIGPRFRLGGSNPTYLDGFLIFRTATDLDELAVDRLGYALRLEQSIGGRGTIRVGGTVFSEILPIEREGLSDRENSLATFLLHRDFRDSYDVAGWTAYLRIAPRGGPTDFTIEFADERHRAVAPADPWSIIRGDEPWRPNPLVAEGDLQTLRARLSYDTRNEELDPAAGWFIRLALEKGVGGNLNTPLDVISNGADPFATQERAHFTTGSLDVRSYTRVAPYAGASFRFFAAGSIDGETLPPQRQRALGGEGSLPAFALFQFDCSARTRRIELRSQEFFPHYGCDRTVLLQVEYQAGFPFLRRLGRRLGLPIDLGQQVRWATFFDAGRAWTPAEATDGRGRGQPDLAADVGIGVRVGMLGFYWVVPLSDDGSGLNFFLRLGRRF